MRALGAALSVSVILGTHVKAGGASVEDEVVSDMLAIREEIKVCSATSENAEGHRDDFVDVLNNELGIDCKTVSVSTEGIELNVEHEGLEQLSVEHVEDVEIVSAKAEADNLNRKATEVVQVTNSYNEKVYTLPVQDVKDFKSGATIEVEQVPIYLGSIQSILSSDIEYPEWDTRKRFKDILILEDILVDQLGVSKSIASAIIGNICYEGSFASIQDSTSSLSSQYEANAKLGDGSTGFGIAQWTSKFRQNKLKEYYNIASQDLDWDTATVVAECIYLYNELKASGLLGDLTQEYSLEDATGKLGYEYLAYANRDKEWYKQGSHYKSNDCPRYNYAVKVYHYMTGE